MKRIFALWVAIILLLAAFVPSAFCVAEPGDQARFGELLTCLEGVDNYATGQVLGWIEEAEGLLDSPDVQAAYSAEERAKVALYRRYFYRDDTLAAFRDSVKLHQYVRFAATDKRTYYQGEWEIISTLYDATIEAVEAAETHEAMLADTADFYDAVDKLPTYDDVRSLWVERVDRVVGDYVAAFAAKVAAYRTANGLEPMSAPSFDAYSISSSVQNFGDYAAANMDDASALVEAFRQGVESIQTLDYYAQEGDMRPLLGGFSSAVEAAVIRAQDVRSALDIVKDHAVDALRRAIDSSQYVASLTDEADVTFYRQALPELMRAELADAEDEDEVQEILMEYLDFLDSGSLQEGTVKPKKLDVTAILAIITGSLSVVLLVVYFVLRARNKGKKIEKKSAAEMLAELQEMAAKRCEGSAETGEGEQPDAIVAEETVGDTDVPTQETQQEQEAKPLCDGEEE